MQFQIVKVESVENVASHIMSCYIQILLITIKKYQRVRTKLISRQLSQYYPIQRHCCLVLQIKSLFLARIMVDERKPVLARVLLNSGSQVSFVSASLIRQIKIPIRRFDKRAYVNGIENSGIETTHLDTFVIRSCLNDFSLNVEGNIIPSVSYRSNTNVIVRLKEKYSLRVFADDCFQ